MGNLNALKDLIFESDNKACFIERERILTRLEKEMSGYSAPDKYAVILAKLLSEVSTPILDCDYFAGRAVEALPDENMSAPSYLLCSTGHMSFDYEKLLAVGFKGILEEIKASAAARATSDAAAFARNAEIIISAIRDFARRYADAAAEKGFDEMSRALRCVPFEPAYDFYSALQSIWIVHMIASCYVGSRDYAFGRFDQYMYSYYKDALAQGHTRDELTELLAGFMIKANEICGRTAHNHQCKPVLCHSSKQYMNIGGEAPNEFSSVVLKAAEMNCMVQPVVTVLLKPEADAAFTDAVFHALPVLTEKMHIYHYEPIYRELLRKGIDDGVAKDYTYSACCTFDLNYHSFRLEYFLPAPQLFLEVLHKEEYPSFSALTEAFQDALRRDIQKYTSNAQKGFDEERSRKSFVLDSLLLSDSAKECRYACDGNAKYNVLNIFCPGIATIGDSLMVLDKLVFTGKRFTFGEFARILEADFAGHEALLAEIKGYTKFGNDSPADDYTALAGNLFLNAVEAVEHRPNYYLAPGFYSLERDNSWSANIGATPDGRRAGEPFSENQSPTYGADKNGVTALLQSLAKLPFDRTVTGGLNLTFSQKLSPDILRTLVLTYFRLGGFHAGISVVDHETFRDAMVHPDKYKSLTVRLYGFSEYFISLPDWQQLAILNRTANSV